MRRAGLPGVLGLTICLVAGSVALLILAHREASGGSGLIAALALATAAAIELARPMAIFGLHGRLGVWLLVALTGLLTLLEIVRVQRARAAKLAPKPAPKPVPPRPYALPARVAVALQAAARARK